jgi:hypothetical protein
MEELVFAMLCLLQAPGVSLLVIATVAVVSK